MSNKKPSNKIKQTTKVIDTVVDVVELFNTVVKLIKKVNQLENTIVEMNTKSPRKISTTRNMSVEDIRNIFTMSIKDKLSGYKISKILDLNSTYIYNILNRKIYQDVDVSDISEEDILDQTNVSSQPLFDQPSLQTTS